MELHIRYVNGYGWLLSAHAGESEIYRGEYQQSYYECLRKYEQWAEERADNEFY